MRPQQLKSNSVLSCLLSLTYGNFHETQKLHGWTDLWSDQIQLFIISSAMSNTQVRMKIKCDSLFLKVVWALSQQIYFASVMVKRMCILCNFSCNILITYLREESQARHKKICQEPKFICRTSHCIFYSTYNPIKFNLLKTWSRYSELRLVESKMTFVSDWFFS